MAYYLGQGTDAPFSAQALGFQDSRRGTDETRGPGGGLGGDAVATEVGVTGLPNRRNCRRQCAEEGYKPGTPGHEQCMQRCQDEGDGTGTTDNEGGCPKECADKGLIPGTPEFQACVQECRGCPDGQHLENGTCVPDVIDRPCRPGFHTDPATGECVPDSEGGECEGGHPLQGNNVVGGGGSVWTDNIIKPEHGWKRNPLGTGHQIWNDTYGHQNINDVHNFIQTGTDLTPNMTDICGKGFTKKTIGGQEWCCPQPGDFDGDGGGGGGLGEFNFSPEMQDFWKLLLGRGTELLGMPLGITPEEQSAMFGKDFENIQGRAGAQREAIRPALSRSGQLGTGTELESSRKISRGIEEEISDAMRDLLIYGSERKKSDLLDYTGAAQSIFGQGQGFEGLREALNAGRRGEGRDAMNDFWRFVTGMFV